MMDQKREQEVWKRVMEVSAQAPECCKMTKKEPTAAEQVVELLQLQKRQRELYEELAKHLQNPARQKLLYIAKQEQQRTAMALQILQNCL